MNKLSLKTYGTFIFLGIVANILIFYIFSKQFEEYIYYKTFDKYKVIKQVEVVVNEQEQVR
jgi:hypothetical protein